MKTWDKEPSCLDAAYEREAVKSGLVKNPVFPENVPKVVDSIVEKVIDKFKNRSEVGIKKYVVTLDRGDLTLVQWLDHAIEESMDFTLYLTKIKEELLNASHTY